MDEQIFGGADVERESRAVLPAMRRGLAGRCPKCGRGHLFRAFLKTVDQCEVCGEEIAHHRADDLPAYLVIVIVGHIVIGAFMGLEAATNWPTWLHLAIWVPLTVVLALAMIGPVKGAVVGLQWALLMHGFGGEPDIVESHTER